MKPALIVSGTTTIALASSSRRSGIEDSGIDWICRTTRTASLARVSSRIDGPRHPMLTTLAPGERVLVAGGLGVAPDDDKPVRNGGGGGEQSGQDQGEAGGGDAHGDLRSGAAGCHRGDAAMNRS